MGFICCEYGVLSHVLTKPVQKGLGADEAPAFFLCVFLPLVNRDCCPVSFPEVFRVEFGQSCAVFLYPRKASPVGTQQR